MMITEEELRVLEKEVQEECARSDADGPIERTLHQDVISLIAEIRRIRVQTDNAKTVIRSGLFTEDVGAGIPCNYYCARCMYPFRSDIGKCPLCGLADKVQDNRQE